MINGTTTTNGGNQVVNPTQIDADGGTLELTGNINAIASGSPLVFVADGSSEIAVARSGIGIGSNVGDVTMDGSPNSTLFLNATDVYQGNTIVTCGTMVTDNVNAIPDGTSLTVTCGTFAFDIIQTLTVSSVNVGSGATLDLGGNNLIVTGSVTLYNGSIINGTILSAASYVLDNANVAAILSGGSATISDSVTFTNADTLSAIIVNSGATLNIDAALTCSGSVTDAGTVNLDGMSDNFGVITVTGGSITNGTISATSFALTGATIAANLSGGVPRSAAW